MLPALVLLLVYNLWCTHVSSFHLEPMDGIIRKDLLLELIKRMDAKDEEIQELQGIQKLQEENINKLVAQIDAHDVDINELRKKLNEKDNAISELDQSKQRQDKTLNELKHAVTKLQFENVQLRKSYPKCARRIKALQAVMKKYMLRHTHSQSNRLEKTSIYANDEAKAIDEIETKRGFNKTTSPITVTNNRRNPIGKNQKERRHAGTDMVAFFAALQNNAQNLGVGQNVKCEHVVTNIGSAYNPHAGAFFAPVTGTYVFMSTVMSYLGHNGHFQVVHNGNMVCKLCVAGAAVTTHETSAASVVLYLQKGDMVSIQNVDSGEYLIGDHYSYFSGFLLKEMENSPSVVG